LALIYWCAIACSFSTDISESDLIYTETLMQRGEENYVGKEIVILGGGDGALLWELLKEKPKFVYMLEVGIILMCYCLPALFKK
jgi:spermine synthase